MKNNQLPKPSNTKTHNKSSPNRPDQSPQTPSENRTRKQRENESSQLADRAANEKRIKKIPSSTPHQIIVNQTLNRVLGGLELLSSIDSFRSPGADADRPKRDDDEIVEIPDVAA